MAKLDLGSATSGAAGGASTGLGIGGAPGAVAGGLLGFAGGLFAGRKKKKKRSTLDKRQQQINEQQGQGILGQGPLADLYNYDPEKANAVFDKTIARKSLRDWNETTVPGITGRFRSEGLENSSYVTDALGKSGRDVQENLDAQRSKYLYDTENEAKGARRNAVENYQNRTNFDYDTSNQGGFDIGRIMDSIPKEALESVIAQLTRRASGGQ